MNKKILLLVAFFPAASFALSLPGFKVPVKSFAEVRFGEVIRQQYDFSCGSAALASLLTHHYNMPFTEAQIFEEMYRLGDKDKIETQGFSMLDMKNFLARRGLDAEGYRMNRQDILSLGIPAIALVNYEGYNHFVVVKGITEDKVLIGDPSLGLHVIDAEGFDKSSNGVFLLIKDKMDIAKASFNNQDNWEHSAPNAPTSMALRQKLPHFTELMLPADRIY
ncbi:C39 family peptidase [Zobellella iuensis]|uniref:C39 family peptidase n=1 Tax=Zobellella iuensis TaxID=2803811 RepID=A0ABS1QSE4_9GAMM|nr:C39 family peptidase [Zobellella iuensis]MBL1377462.1 C39 family peptidase [Zobellella iuensis]